MDYRIPEFMPPLFDEEPNPLLPQNLPPFANPMFGAVGKSAAVKASVKSIISLILRTVEDVALIDPTPESLGILTGLCTNYDMLLTALKMGLPGLSYKIIGPLICPELPQLHDLSHPSATAGMLVALQQLVNGCHLIMFMDNWHSAVEIYKQKNKASGELPIALKHGSSCYGIDMFMGGVSGIQLHQNKFYKNAIPPFSPRAGERIQQGLPMVEYKGTTMNFAHIILSTRKAFLPMF